MLGKAPETKTRDAIHVGIIAIEAGELLHPGWHVGVRSDGKAWINTDQIGIVDPFLKDLIQPGEIFWLMMYPDSVEHIRHDWIHPAFPDTKESEAWLQGVAVDLSYTYEHLRETAEEFSNQGLRVFDLVDWRREYLLERQLEFRQHVKAAWGYTLDDHVFEAY